MTLEQLDVVRGWSIAAVLLSFVVIGLASKLSSRAGVAMRMAAKLIGSCAGLTLFTILNFVAGWDAYFAAKASGLSTAEYHGRQVIAARVIQHLGEMDASGLGIVFGMVGLALAVSAVLDVRTMRDPRRQST